MSRGFHVTLSWKGLTRSDLLALFDSAKSYCDQGKYRPAENLFLQAIEGYRYLVGPTYKDVTKAAYALVSLYMEMDRMADADRVIEDITLLYIKNLGYEYRRT